MFVKRLLKKAGHDSKPQQRQQHHHDRNPLNNGDGLIASDLDPRITVHYGVPYTASILAFDPIQRLLAIGTLDGRIKVMGGDNIEGLLLSQKQFPYKYLEFLQNKGVLIGISSDNDIQVWSLENRSVTSSLQWETNITAFSVLCGSHYMYIGDEYGAVSVLKYMTEDEKLLKLPYHMPATSLTDVAGLPFLNHQPIVGVLPQPCSLGKRVVIAVESGLIILWDVPEARAVTVRGDKVLELKGGAPDSSVDAENGSVEEVSELNAAEKEISALCWASSDGSVLAVGYINGDILFWRTLTAFNKGNEADLSDSNVAKLQLSSGEKKLPVIVLHWCTNYKFCTAGDGKLFVYGGAEIGSEEVITVQVLSLEWSSRMETLRCIGRMEIKVTGSFADMILLPPIGSSRNKEYPTVFVLTNPGKLLAVDIGTATQSGFQTDVKKSMTAAEMQQVIPAIPSMTVAQLFLLPTDEKFSMALFEAVSSMKLTSTPTFSGRIKWSLTGGVLYHLPEVENNGIERLYVAGYEDGSVWMWDATYPVLSIVCVLEGELKGLQVAHSSASVTTVNFCFANLNFAVGNDCGLVRLYDCNGQPDDASFHLLVGSTHEVHKLPQGQGLICRAIFNLLESPVYTLEFIKNGAQLAIGYESGHVALVDLNTFSASFLIESVAAPSVPVITIVSRAFKCNNDSKEVEVIFILTKDAQVFVLDAHAGKMTNSMHLKESEALSMYVIECGASGKKQPQPCERVDADMTTNEHPQKRSASESHANGDQGHPFSNCCNDQGDLEDSLLLLCSKDALRVYPVASVVVGNKKSICKVKLSMPCLWTMAFRKGGRISGLVLLYQNGHMEIRSFPSLELVVETSLVSILRYNVKARMDRAINYTENGHIALACGSEVVFISLLSSENDFRIPECLPCLHDTVLAAAAEAAISFSSNQNKKGAGSGILGVIKGLIGGKENTSKLVSTSNSNSSHLDDIFSRNPFLDPNPTVSGNQEAFELDIDDIEIDEPSTSHNTDLNNAAGQIPKKLSNREKLFDGKGNDAKPRTRTPEEIIATYRKTGDVQTVAGQARNKLFERQEKLEKISRRTEDMRNEAENFASLANELVKTMENRKWWQI